jgi:carbamoyl-phosphate synthase large subunit/carbamoyl-phosphate synthase small subunit
LFLRLASRSGQILVLTYPIIGNYGVPPADKICESGLPLYFESDSVHITALIVCDYSAEPCHWNLTQTLSAWLRKHKVPALFGLDTRALTKRIRDRGAMLGKIVFAPDTAASVVQMDPNNFNLVAQVSVKEPKLYLPRSNVAPRLVNGKQMRVVAIDCGMKHNIIRYFVSHGVELLVVPWDYDFSHEQYDGLFISNGPGDPTKVTVTVERVRVALQADKPIFGICLGNQILALAAGAQTYKMKYGNRGMNQPVIDTRTSRCYITAQNHGYAVDNKSLPDGWQPFFINGNDQSNEGIIHQTKPFFSVQFHPEASGGPTDTDFLFTMFLDKINNGAPPVTLSYTAPKPYVRKVLLLGSGGLSIGQAGEFDYSGSQAIKALKELGIYTVLINPNIATVQTSAGMADKVYFYPITIKYVEAVILKEAPESILLQFGGQTALNCGIELENSGILAKYGIQVLGTPVSAIVATEDREIFNAKLAEINESTAPSDAAENVEDAVKAARRIGYPVIMRAGFALGGLGSGFANSDEEARALATNAFANSPQVLVERSLRGWKEIEYEVVRDAKDNCITVCNMENFDPLGIHTGDSIVVAPSQTLSNTEYYKLRSTAIKVARHLGIVGECNIQYALDPMSEDYYIIEVNARLSRSSALASKATGYPLAYVAAKLALGTPLTEIRNSVTKQTMACFEPSLDYVVVKIPRWDLQKFAMVGKVLGSAMKSIGEVMSIGRTFPEAMQKAIRMATPGCDGFETTSSVAAYTQDELENHLTEASDERVHVVAEAFNRGYEVQRIHELTRINHWFLLKLQSVINLRRTLEKFTVEQLPLPTLLYAKQNGFSDCQIAKAIKSTEDDVRSLRVRHGITPWVKQVDTLAAEFPAVTNYLYMTYNGIEHDVVFNEHGTMVLGCGAYRIGSSVEFDWCAVGCVRTLRKMGHHSIMVNYNPETVSTDYDECDRLYFEEISRERVLDIYQLEASAGVILSVGGQIPNNLALTLHHAGVKILGTSAENVDNAEDRFKFSKILDSIGVDQPLWKELQSVPDAKLFCNQVSYPCLIRPSYVLSGAAMKVVFNDTVRARKTEAQRALRASQCERAQHLPEPARRRDLYGRCSHPLTHLLALSLSLCVRRTSRSSSTRRASSRPTTRSSSPSSSRTRRRSTSTRSRATARSLTTPSPSTSRTPACTRATRRSCCPRRSFTARPSGAWQQARAPPRRARAAAVRTRALTRSLGRARVRRRCACRRVKRVTFKIAQRLNITGPFNIQFLSKDNRIKVIECNLRASRTFPFVSKVLKVGARERARARHARAGHERAVSSPSACASCPRASIGSIRSLARRPPAPPRVPLVAGGLHRDCDARDDGRGRQARAHQPARDRLRGDQGADVLVHPAGRRRPDPRRRDGLHRRGGHVRRHAARGDRHVDARGRLQAAPKGDLPLHRPARGQAGLCRVGAQPGREGPAPLRLQGHARVPDGAGDPVDDALQAERVQLAKRPRGHPRGQDRPRDQHPRLGGGRGLGDGRLLHPPLRRRPLDRPAHRPQARVPDRDCDDARLCRRLWKGQGPRLGRARLVSWHARRARCSSRTDERRGDAQTDGAAQ